MALSLRDTLQIAPDVVSRELDGEIVVLNLESGTYFGLDAVGARVWQLLQEDGALQKVFDAMHTEFDVAADTLEQDLLSLVGELCERGLSRVRPNGRE